MALGALPPEVTAGTPSSVRIRITDDGPQGPPPPEPPPRDPPGGVGNASGGGGSGGGGGGAPPLNRPPVAAEPIVDRQLDVGGALEIDIPDSLCNFENSVFRLRFHVG